VARRSRWSEAHSRRSASIGAEAKEARHEQREEIDRLKAALTAETATVENKRQAMTQLFADIERRQADAMKATTVKLQQSAEIEKLKAALATETAKVETECFAKRQAFKERDAVNARIQDITAYAESTKATLSKNMQVAADAQMEKIQALQKELSESRTAKIMAERNVRITTVEVKNLKLEIQRLTEQYKRQQTQDAEYAARLQAENKKMKSTVSEQQIEFESMKSTVTQQQAQITTMKPAVDEQATLLSQIEVLKRKLEAYLAASMFITETKTIAHTPTISWTDELSFPMLVKNDQTGERNVLSLYHLEAENVPNMSSLSEDGQSNLYIKISLPPISNATTGETGLTYLLLQLYHHERNASDKLVAQGLIQVRGVATGEKKGCILFHLNCLVKGLADSVLFRCQYAWRSSTSAVEQLQLHDGGMPADLPAAKKRQLRIRHLVFEARQTYELIFNHMDRTIKQNLGETCPAVAVELYRKHTINVLKSIDFAKGKALLDAVAETTLIQVAKAIKEVHKLSSKHGIPPLIVSVEGHTNCKDPAKRSNAYHMRLSEERATACREYLEGAGVDPKYLQSKGFGGTVRISETKPTLNQRTEFNVVDNFEEEIQRRIAAELERESKE